MREICVMAELLDRIGMFMLYGGITLVLITLSFPIAARVIEMWYEVR